jgi:ribonuclease P protein component
VGLPSEHRLKRRSDFQTVYKKGIRRSSRHFILRAFPANTNSATEPITTKIGISVSRKVSKKAVERNRIKRQIRTVFRTLLPRISSPWLIVIVVKPEAKECKYEHFLRELEKLLIQAEIIYGY